MVNKIRWKQRFQNFERAYTRRSDGVELKNYDSLQEAGLIQTFEFTFELGWKTLKDYLELLGFDASSPRDVIKQAFQAGFVSNGHLWLDALDKRNLMSFS
jgi:nucleotidyltransferase substrate binding protein (TIGR01987 family)